MFVVCWLNNVEITKCRKTQTELKGSFPNFATISSILCTVSSIVFPSFVFSFHIPSKQFHKAILLTAIWLECKRMLTFNRVWHQQFETIECWPKNVNKFNTFITFATLGKKNYGVLHRNMRFSSCKKTMKIWNKKNKNCLYIQRWNKRPMVFFCQCLCANSQQSGGMIKTPETL